MFAAAWLTLSAKRAGLRVILANASAKAAADAQRGGVGGDRAGLALWC
jgi:hypothetical protein